MEPMQLVSSWYHLHSSVPSSYVQPPERRPGNTVFASGKTIPVIDLGGNDRNYVFRNIIKASEDYGIFQVINHGVCKELLDATMKMFKEFHAMAAEVKISESSKDPNGSCKLYTSSGRRNRDVADYWKDTLAHPCPPSGEFMEYWPQKPLGYREVVGKYTKEVRRLGLQILELLSEGLGVEDREFFSGGLSDSPILLSHLYPPCAEPSLTLGASRHRDPNLFTILLQEPDISALQVFKDGECILVDPIPYAFVVNIGIMLQIVTNEKLVAPEHRVITNSTRARHSVVYFVNPTKETIVEPSKHFISPTTPPMFRSMRFGDIWEQFLIKGPNFFDELRLISDKQQK